MRVIGVVCVLAFSFLVPVPLFVLMENECKFKSEMELYVANSASLFYEGY